MVFIKYILMFFILGTFILIGRLYAKKYENRLKELEEFDLLLNIFKAKIKFTSLGIQEIFNEIYENNKTNIGRIFKDASKLMNKETNIKAWENAINKNKENIYLNKEDIEAICSLGKLLGNTDLEGQVSQIELTKNLLKKQIEEAKIEKNKNSKLYKTLGATIGFTIVIILM